MSALSRIVISVLIFASLSLQAFAGHVFITTIGGVDWIVDAQPLAAIGGINEVRFTTNISTGSGEDIFTDISIFTPFASFNTDGKTFLQVTAGSLIQESDLPLAGGHFSPSPFSLVNQFLQPNAFTYTEIGPLGQQTGIVMVVDRRVIPEPCSIALFGLGGVMIAYQTRRWRHGQRRTSQRSPDEAKLAKPA